MRLVPEVGLENGQQQPIVQRRSIELPSSVLWIATAEYLVFRKGTPTSTSDSTMALFDLAAECSTGKGSICGASTSTVVSLDVLAED